MNGDLIRAQGLSKFYTSGEVSVKALQDASFTVDRGEFIVVLGHSGSGKSTLLNLLGGMDRPTEGTLYYQGRDLTALTDRELVAYRRDVVGFVFQFFNLIPSLTAYENIKLAASVAQNPIEVQRALELVGLEDRGGHFPAQLSGGEQQRVSIARAIVKNPALLLCDEPTGALDSTNGLAVIRLLAQARDQLGCPVVTITHNAEIAEIADRVFHMKDGRIERIAVNEHPLPAEEFSW
ncbi:MAG: ABC transporter ATP-binding protein [Clostridiales bacterium]|nr:ABC transporter ATP-binding protein [Clostridiales bacterium]